MKGFVILLFLCFLHHTASKPQKNDDVAEARAEIKFNSTGHGANGPDNGGVRNEDVLENFKNPILEYLLKGSPRLENKPSGIRHIQHSQTLLIPRAEPPGLHSVLRPLHVDSPAVRKPQRDPAKTPMENFLNYVNNEEGSMVTSPTLHLLRNKEMTRVQVYPAVAVVINTFDKDGGLRNSVTHFQPQFADPGERDATSVTVRNHTMNSQEDRDQVQKIEYSEHVNESSGAMHSKLLIQNAEKKKVAVGETYYEESSVGRQPSGRQGPQLTWPFAQYFPIVINDPFLAAYNAITSSMYNTFTSMVEYGPEADICRRDGHEHGTERSKVTTEDPNFFGEVQGGTRKRRETGRILVKTAGGGYAGLTFEEPPARSGDWLDDVEERTRVHGMVINPPPLSTILRPPLTGFQDRKKKPGKPQKPNKEENEESSEEVGEEEEEESTSQQTSDGVAISPPPEGASVAEAKPVGLAIAGPGGVAAAKPQGTAVAGPGGLAIARPVGTAIAGVDVEGSIPIGAQQQKNKKKKPKQDADTEDELQYVGGLTGPIGNPQPKQFDEERYFGGLKGPMGQPLPVGNDDMLFRGSGFGLRLGHHGGRYGFVPMRMAPADRMQKRMDGQTFFHGMLGAREGEPQPYIMG